MVWLNPSTHSSETAKICRDNTNKSKWYSYKKKLKRILISENVSYRSVKKNTASFRLIGLSEFEKN